MLLLVDVSGYVSEEPHILSPLFGIGPPSELLTHVLHFQRLDRLPVEAKLAHHIADRRGPTATADVEGEPLGVVEVVGQPRQLLLLHGAAALAMHAPDLDLQVHPGVATRKVAHSTGLAVVKGSLPPSTRSTGRFFPRRRSRKIRALGSPKMPRTVASGRKPVNRYASSSRRGFRIRSSCQIFRLEEKGGNPSKQGVSRPSDAIFYPLGWEKSHFVVFRHASAEPSAASTFAAGFPPSADGARPPACTGTASKIEESTSVWIIAMSPGFVRAVVEEWHGRRIAHCLTGPPREARRMETPFVTNAIGVMCRPRPLWCSARVPCVSFDLSSDGSLRKPRHAGPDHLLGERMPWPAIQSSQRAIRAFPSSPPMSWPSTRRAAAA